MRDTQAPSAGIKVAIWFLFSSLAGMMPQETFWLPGI
jgi:hypothetical protein